MAGKRKFQNCKIVQRQQSREAAIYFVNSSPTFQGKTAGILMSITLYILTVF